MPRRKTGAVETSTLGSSDPWIDALRASGLVGRGGAAFPSWKKWLTVKDTPGVKKYVIANGSEGEPGVKKDAYILEHSYRLVIDGMMTAIKWLAEPGGIDVKGYLYLNPGLSKLMHARLETAVAGLPIHIFTKPQTAGYIGGEESATINCIEGRRIEPRLKPPLPAVSGLWGCPTLVHNIESFYDIALIKAGAYEHRRYYTINGDCLWTGVHCLPEDLSIRQLLAETKNLPDFDFFVEVGGDGSGEVLDMADIDQPAMGAGSITVYSTEKHEPMKLIRRWVDFFADQSCGQCTPCREGTYRLREIVNGPKPDWVLFAAVLETLAASSLCGLGCAVPVPLRGYIENVLSKHPEAGIGLPPGTRHALCDCLK